MMRVSLRCSAVTIAACCLMVLARPATAVAQATESIKYFHTDAIGSVRMVTGPTGEVLERRDFLPFGEEPAPPPDAQPLGFAGTERDADTGNSSWPAMNYFGARHLHSASGRFLTVDPGHADGTLLDPQSWNGYAYVRNNPLAFVDPDGRQTCPTDYCVTVEGGLNPAMLQAIKQGHASFRFEIVGLLGLLESVGNTVGEVVQPVTDWVTAPRDPRCMAGMTAAGAGIGAAAGYGLGAIGGFALGAPAGGGPAIPLSLGGAKAGAAFLGASGTIGGAVGAYLGCPFAMASNRRGGGGGSGDMTADEIISRYKKASIREVFPGQHLDKTLDELRELAAAGDRAARTAVKLLTDGRFNKP